MLNLLPKLEDNKEETSLVGEDDNQKEKSPDSKSSEPKPKDMIKTGSFKKRLSARSSSPDYNSPAL